ncbi:hypothetical protein G3N55_10380, partial [Dissulfurirhabdus thermomarina]
TATRQAPRYAQPGLPGEERRLRLELKLLAEVGLVGLPNAGKSTLLSRISAARPKVAAYPFTTLRPCLGVVTLPGGRSLVAADIPGLIEGAHRGLGMGLDFLRHVERTRVLLHVMDASEGPEAARRAYETVRAEMAAYGAGLDRKPGMVALNKVDLLAPADREAVKGAFAGEGTFLVSAATGEGLPGLLEALYAEVARAEAARGEGAGEEAVWKPGA